MLDRRRNRTVKKYDVCDDGRPPAQSSASLHACSCWPPLPTADPENAHDFRDVPPVLDEPPSLIKPPSGCRGLSHRAAPGTSSKTCAKWRHRPISNRNRNIAPLLALSGHTCQFVRLRYTENGMPSSPLSLMLYGFFLLLFGLSAGVCHGIDFAVCHGTAQSA